MKWGILPRWAKDTYQIIFTARNDGVVVKSTFKDLFRKRRCLIVADGYYEWKREGTDRRPFYFRLKEGQPFAFAGIVGEFRYLEGTEVRACTIITTIPNAVEAEVHDRMPVILKKEDEPRWLETAENKASGLTELLMRYSADRMELWEVGQRVARQGLTIAP